MRPLFVVVIGVLLASCHQRKPAMSDADFRLFRASHPTMSRRCLDEARYSGDWASRLDDPDCFEMLPDQRWSGRWDSGWEWSIFCQDAAKNCGAANGGTWMTVGKGTHLPDDFGWGVYHVQFIGRRTKTPGYFGHLDQYSHLMVVDRFLSIQKIPGQKYVVPFPKSQHGGG